MKKEIARNIKARPVAFTLLTTIFLMAICSGCSLIRESQRRLKRDSARVAKDIMAIQTLIEIAHAQQRYRDSRGDGSYGTFEQLAEAKLIGERFAASSPVVEGYKYTMLLMPRTGEQQAMFKINADPYQADTKATGGKRHFYIDSDAPLYINDAQFIDSDAVHVNDKQPATARDPVL